MTTSAPPLLLASSSRYRADLLSRLGVPFTQCAPEVDESRLDGESAEAYVERLARAKAHAGATLSDTNSVCIGSDQAAILGDRIIGKPGTGKLARHQLLAASGRRVTFLTAVAVLDAHSGATTCDVVDYHVIFRTLTPAEIDRYVVRDKPLDCAGAFRAEGLGTTLFERMEGNDPSALIGLPLIALCRRLRRLGYPLP
ncbi:MAG TPA: Maf family protein [Gammaproteobacteria bacterium]|nr:Maf family protein [Gammaproteobacteria bacterium]